MHKNYLACLFMVLFVSCTVQNKKEQQYENQIGDTRYINGIDDSKFTFCDTLNVLHKRALIRYKGGNNALEKDLIANFKFHESYASVHGYCIVRLAVNCKDEVGRYRLETLDANYDVLKFPQKLEASLLSSIKELSGWTHPRYKGEDRDGYGFFIIKIANGKITLP